MASAEPRWTDTPRQPSVAEAACAQPGGPGPTGDPRRRRVQADRRGESSDRRAEHPGRSLAGRDVPCRSLRRRPGTNVPHPAQPLGRGRPRQPCGVRRPHRPTAGPRRATARPAPLVAGRRPRYAVRPPACRAAQDRPPDTDECVGIAASISSASRRGSRPAPASHTTSLRAPAAITPTPQATPLRSPTHPAPRAGSAPSAPRQPSSSEYRRVVRLPGGYSFDMTPSSPPRSGASAPPRAAQCRDPVFHELHRPDEDGPHPRQRRRLEPPAAGAAGPARAHRPTAHDFAGGGGRANPDLCAYRDVYSRRLPLWPDRRSWHHRVRPSSVETDAHPHQSTVATAATLTRSHVLLRAGLRAVSRCTAQRMVTAPPQIMNAPCPRHFNPSLRCVTPPPSSQVRSDEPIDQRLHPVITEGRYTGTRTPGGHVKLSVWRRRRM